MPWTSSRSVEGGYDRGMCWCTPNKRTPCCATDACHRAAIVKGNLKPGEKCPFCQSAAVESGPPFGPPRPAKREISEEIRVIMRTECERCKRCLEFQQHIPPRLLDRETAPTIITEARAYVREQLGAAIVERGWTDAMCGQCRDRETTGEPHADARSAVEALLVEHAGRVGSEAAFKDFATVLERFAPGAVGIR